MCVCAYGRGNGGFVGSGGIQVHIGDSGKGEIFG